MGNRSEGEGNILGTSGLIFFNTNKRLGSFGSSPRSAITAILDRNITNCHCKIFAYLFVVQPVYNSIYLFVVKIRTFYVSSLLTKQDTHNPLLYVKVVSMSNLCSKVFKIPKIMLWPKEIA